jgi:hypothetical protein
VTRSERHTVSAVLLAALVVLPAPLLAQEREAVKPASWQIASAVLAVPEPLREGAEVRGWTADGGLTVLRPGTNDIICLADRADQDGFAAACYHASLEPFMERGRVLTRQGVAGAARDEMRWREIEDGTLPMPAMAMVYNLRYATDDFDPATFDPATAARLHAFYIRGATPESTGVTAQPGDAPWLMQAGTPTAHIMISLPVRRRDP